MKDLSNDARSLLDSARRADSAPAVVRERARRNFARAVAAGTLSASATVAKAASLGAFSSLAPAGASVAAGSSLAVTLVSAVITGASLGAIAIAPASRIEPTANSVATLESRAPSLKTQERPAPSRNESGNDHAAADDTAKPDGTALPAVQPPPEVSVRKPSASPIASVTPEPAPVADAPPSSAVAAFDPVANTKASIARETALLAEVQRALQQGEAASALSLLNRYQSEFPRGALQEEAMASRIVALCQFGRGADAARWQSEFMRRYPSSPLSSRVRNACAPSLQSGAK